ncbi:ATP-binding protein [Clostridium sp. SHJSY1]|uniref:ATP-binding protein n=1 Tax=Clostridium sp. SHJSY1 TaxID=2942483 RepID=UPI00287654BE|nr:ATP-binding protein [Clostridium sp. SHJSY1]MDS0525562.1 ATP-binding protein [Clostridium sp. SHJSY1]
MKYSEVLDTINLIIETGEVSLIIGESGIGKTALVHELAKENNYSLVTIDANLLKEGEIGGLPTVNKGETIYATHYKLVDIRKAINEEKEVLLFVDELNRCEHAVQQELMNLILNREINGYTLGKNVNIIAAMNPSNKYDNFRDSEYQVVDMDPAQEDRFVWVEMDSDIKEWIRWGMGKGKINNDIIEFLSAFPQYLHTPESRDNLKATPRSWERVSKAYKLYKSNEKYSLSTLLNVVRGNVGDSICTDFANYITNIKKQLILPEKLFSYEVLPIEIKEEISNESHSRLYILMKNSLNYVGNNLNENSIIRLSELLGLYPRDLRLGIMKEIRRDYRKNLYEKLLDCDEFLESFFEVYTRV